MSISRQIAAKFPNLKDDFKRANLDIRPADYVAKNLRNSFVMSLMISLLSFFLISGSRVAAVFSALAVFAVLFAFFFWFMMQSVKVKILRRGREMEKEVLFAGRFLLVKLRSGKPLINALVDASKSYGVANDFFKQIIRDIDLGTPLEDALENSVTFCPSENFRRILFQINNALKIGVDVTSFLEAILDEIGSEQLIEIQKYGKKLNGMTMFYMLMAVIFPSLGVSMFIIVSSMISVNLGFEIYLLLGFVMLVIEFIFISMFRSIRPNVNI